MKKQNWFTGFLLVGFGIFFFLRQLNIPLFEPYYSWPTFLIIIGLAFLLHSYFAKEYQTVFAGIILLLFGIHFHGLAHYSFWIDHWAVYPFIIGIGLIVKSQKSQGGLLPGLLLVLIAMIALFISPGWLNWLSVFFQWLERFWPVTLILFGSYMLIRKK
ncbi:DUF5668 domain-containing protein [Halobacillus salinarum]|uniref:DUF5668 domain-containing protein n=1 Tax=Halobacillus salinarum TaxID=2932257 RepID=A0ABY4EPV5_9BACI|nr:DUF5668 domain-containing protein [Halobacillus salinarum]UOQ46234.1 DUF5668 domain-containing protein [Halobacillus salinarum]